MGLGRLNYNNAGGYFEHLDGTRTVWRSDAAPAFLLPVANTLTATVNLPFPDFNKDHNLMWYGVTGSSPTLFYGNSLFEKINAGEDWGPAGVGAFNLPRISVGSVPAGCNYIDVAAVFTHTSPAPGGTQIAGSFNFVPIVDYQKPGQVIHLDGGFATLEGAEPWRRAMAVVKDSDGTVWVERYQSVASGVDTSAQPIKPGVQSYDGSATGAWNNYFTTDGTSTGWISALIGGGDNNVMGMRGGSHQPTPIAGWATDFRSTWSVALTIRPGYAHT